MIEALRSAERYNAFFGTVDYTLTADPGSYSVSGTAASLEYGRNLVAASGSYAVTGTAADLEYGRNLGAASGSYAVSGTAAALQHDQVIPPGSGTFNWSGADATLTYQGGAQGGGNVMVGSAAYHRSSGYNYTLGRTWAARRRRRGK